MHRGEELLILSVDTASDVRSVAVARGTHLLSLCQGGERNTHSANVLSEIDAALGEAGVALEQVELFAVASGPGSFTGLRAGLATMKAFAATLERPSVGVPTLHAVALAAGASARVVAAIPAGRGEVFAQLLEVTNDARIVEWSAPAHVAPAVLLDEMAKHGASLKWAGGGAHALADAIRERALREGLRFVVESEHHTEGEERTWTLAPRHSALAGHVAALAHASFGAGRAVRADELRALYVRASDAEINEQCRAPNHSSK